MTHTDYYKVASGKYLGAIAKCELGRRWWFFLFPLALFIVGFYDWRWAVVGLMLLFLVYPFGLTIALLNNALRPEVIGRASSNFAKFDEENITIFKKKAEETDNSDDKNVELDKIETKKIVEIVNVGKFTKIIVGSKFYDFILIPNDSIIHHE